MYTTLVGMLSEAEELNMAIGAFNAHNLEMVPAIVRAASNQKTPVIIQTSEGTAKYVGMRTLVSVVRSLADEHGVDVALHLDHAKNWDNIREAVDAGYTSVMFDGSSLPFKENILGTKRVVEYAHAAGASVEAELGTVGGTEDGVVVAANDVHLTNPQDAVDFIEKTGIDALAVAIGTNHGQYKSKTNINFDVLESIHRVATRPLVIHGGTGVSDGDIHKVIDRGIRKFNVGTELLVQWNLRSRELYSSNKENTSNRNNVVPALETITEVVEQKIRLFKNI